MDRLESRLAALDAAADAAIVLAVAGSSDERAKEDCRVTARCSPSGSDATSPWGSSLPPNRGSAPPFGPPARADARWSVANYLLAPGYFHDLAVRLADGSPVARPLLDDDEPAASLVEHRDRPLPRRDVEGHLVQLRDAM